MTNPREMILKLKSKLDKNPFVLALVLVGSQARNSAYPASKFSDMEVYIVVLDKSVLKVEEQLTEIVSDLGVVLFSYKNQWAGFSTVFDDLFRLELPIAKLSGLDSVFSRPIAQTVKVLIDKTNGKLESALANRPKSLDFGKIFQDKIVDFWYMLIIAAQYYKKGESYNARSALSVIQSSLIKLFELDENPDIFLLKTNKRIEQFLPKEKLELLREVTPAYEEKQIENSLKIMLEIFPEAAKKVAQKYGYSYPQDIEIKIKPKLQELFDTL